MNEIVTQLISGVFAVIVAIVGISVQRQASRAKKREEEIASVSEREQSIWNRLEHDVEKQGKRIKALEEGLERAEQRAFDAERERDRLRDEVRDRDQVIEAFIKDRLDLDAWVNDGGQPPVPGAHWRVVQLIARRTDQEYGDDGNV